MHARRLSAEGLKTAKKISAGLLLNRRRGDLEVFLVHPGGPFWSKKDAGAWSVPKGETVDGEEPLQTAKREFLEETGFTIEGDCSARNGHLCPAGRPERSDSVP